MGALSRGQKPILRGRGAPFFFLEGFNSIRELKTSPKKTDFGEKYNYYIHVRYLPHEKVPRGLGKRRESNARQDENCKSVFPTISG